MAGIWGVRISDPDGVVWLNAILEECMNASWVVGSMGGNIWDWSIVPEMSFWSRNLSSRPTESES
jgi:hypothetical protein